MRPPIAAERLDDWSDLACLLETICWIVAWLALPAWLGFRGATLGQYAGYAAGSGMIMAAGVIGTNLPHFRSSARFVAEFVLAAIMAVGLVGGGVFALARWLAG